MPDSSGDDLVLALGKFGGVLDSLVGKAEQLREALAPLEAAAKKLESLGGATTPGKTAAQSGGNWTISDGKFVPRANGGGAPIGEVGDPKRADGGGAVFSGDVSGAAPNGGGALFTNRLAGIAASVTATTGPVLLPPPRATVFTGAPAPSPAAQKAALPPVPAPVFTQTATPQASQPTFTPPPPPGPFPPLMPAQPAPPPDIQWGGVASGALQIASGAAQTTFALMPDANEGVRRQKLAFVSSYGTGYNNQVMRNVMRQAIGDGITGSNSDMEAALIATNNLRIGPQEQAQLGSVAKWAQGYGISNQESVQQQLGVYESTSANNLLNYAGVAVTNADGSDRPLDQIVSDVYNNQFRGQFDGPDGQQLLSQYLRYGYDMKAMFGDAAPQAQKMLMEMNQAQTKGMEWSADPTSEFQKSIGKQASPLDSEGERLRAENDKTEAGTDASAAGYDIANEALAKFADATTLAYTELGLFAEALQAIKGGGVAYQNSATGQGISQAVGGVTGMLGGVGSVAAGFGISSLARMAFGKSGLGSNLTGFLSRAGMFGGGSGGVVPSGTVFTPPPPPGPAAAASPGKAGAVVNALKGVASHVPGLGAVTSRLPSLGAVGTGLAKFAGPVGIAVTAAAGAYEGYTSAKESLSTEGNWADKASEHLRKTANPKDKWGLTSQAWQVMGPTGTLMRTGMSTAALMLKKGFGSKPPEAPEQPGEPLDDPTVETPHNASQSSYTEDNKTPPKKSAASDLVAVLGDIKGLVESIDSKMGSGAGPEDPRHLAIERGGSMVRPLWQADGPATVVSPRTRAPLDSSGGGRRAALPGISDVVKAVSGLGSKLGGAAKSMLLKGAEVAAVALPGAPNFARSVLPNPVKKADTVSDSVGGTNPTPTPSAPYDPSGGAEQWRSLVQQVMKDLEIDPKYTDGILGQLNSESGGNPTIWAQDPDNENFRAGYQARGLMQTILPTYQAYGPPGKTSGEVLSEEFKGSIQHYMKEQIDPYNSVYAGLNYARDRYGNRKFDQWSQGIHGPYSAGAYEVPTNQLAALHAREMVLPADVADSVRQALAEQRTGQPSGGTGVVNINVTLNGTSQAEAENFVAVVVDQIQRHFDVAAVTRA